jgi:iron complex transport system substrate-binding protein
MNKKIWICVSVIFVIYIISGNYNSVYAGKYKLITDLDDKQIEVPSDPQRIASMHGPTYDRILMLGKASCIALMPMKPSPWALKLFPEVKDIPSVTSYSELDVEQLLKYKVDLVFYSMFHSHSVKLEAAGIKAACPFSEKKMPATMTEFIENYKRQIRFYGEVLGPDAKIRAQRYCDYFDKTLKRLLSVTAKIPENKKPGVYYGGLNGNLYDTQGKNTIMNWCVEAAGGIFLTRGLKTHYGKVNTEQLIAWNPDFILIGMKGSLDFVAKNPVLTEIKAVKNKKCYMIPVGTFWWDLASGETVLLPLFLAKKLHPDLFKNWDLIHEMKTFYADIYNKKISDEDAERILNALPPI